MAIEGMSSENFSHPNPDGATGIGNIALSCVGIPADVVDRIEAEQDTQQLPVGKSWVFCSGFFQVIITWPDIMD